MGFCLVNIYLLHGLSLARLKRQVNAGDTIRSFVVSGYADPTKPWTDETDLQFRLARESAAEIARRYANAGFAVAIDDILAPDETEELFASRLPRSRVHRVFLQPSLDVALHRNATRTKERFFTSVLTEAWQPPPHPRRM